jgi:hypothetical protein
MAANKGDPKGAVKGEAKGAVKSVEPRLKKIYREQIAPELIKEFGYKTPMQTPKLEKIIVSMGVGEAHREFQNQGRPGNRRKSYPQGSDDVRVF